MALRADTALSWINVDLLTDGIDKPIVFLAARITAVPTIRAYPWAALLLLCVVAESPILCAEEKQPPGAAPKGEVTKHGFENSKIFPGTVRDYWIYVPQQYDPAKPACMHVNQDGIQFKAPEVFDALIHAGEMPVTIGVFVMHGRVKASSDAALDRFNRSYEYDGLGRQVAEQDLVHQPLGREEGRR